MGLFCVVRIWKFKLKGVSLRRICAVNYVKNCTIDGIKSLKNSSKRLYHLLLR